MFSSTFSYLKSILSSFPQRSGKDESASTTNQRRSPVMVDEPMEAVTSTSDDNDDDRVHRAEDPEARNNVTAPSAGKRNGFDQWRIEERKALAQHLVRKEKDTLGKLKEAKSVEDKKFRLPNKFWPKCATALDKKGCQKTDAQCRNQVYALCKISKEEMKNDFELNEEEVDLLFGLWSRKKQQTRRPKGATVRGERSKETWTPEEETKLASYLVRDRKAALEEISEGRNVYYLYFDCWKHFKDVRSEDAYRNRARLMRGYDDNTLRDVYKLTDEEIELFRKPWMDNKKK